MNVCWLGGTALWVLDCIKQMDDWHHTVVWLNGSENVDVYQSFVEQKVDISKIEVVNKTLLNAVEPTIVVLSNTSTQQIEGAWPWNWLTANFQVFYMHHTVIYPWLPDAVADIFVAETIKDKYNALHKHMKAIYVCPPVGSLHKFFLINRTETDKCVVGRIATDNKQKFPSEQLEIIKQTGCPAIIVGGQKYWGPPPSHEIQFPDFGSKPVEKFLSEMDIFVYRTSLTETWGRTITEAMASGIPVVAENRGGPTEQIRNGVDGFLCDTDTDFVEKINMLSKDKNLRFLMGQQARERAKQLEKMNFKNVIEPVMFRQALRG